jgi:hypothetical protein
VSDLSEQAAGALRTILGAEHAAVWVYGLASAFGEGRVRSAIDEAMGEHRARRDAAEQVLRSSGQNPPAAQPAYSLPQPVTDQKSAIRALITAENDCQVGWRSVLETTPDAGIRRTALDGLTTSAARATRWRITIGEHPSAQAFPGQP